MIEDNYYTGFVNLCKKNTKVRSIPLKLELEAADCEISALCYLIDESGRAYNPSVFDPTILSESTRRMFLRAIPIANDKKEEDSVEMRECNFCGNHKPLSDFRRKRGYKSYSKTCLVCEGATTTPATKIHPSVKIEDNAAPTQEKNEVVNITPKKQVAQTTNDTHLRLISLSKAKELVIKAYERGKREALAEAYLDDISLDELLGE